MSDVEISNRDIMILARRAKHSKKKFKTPTGMPIIGVKIEKSELIFRKIENHEIDFQLKKLNDSEK